MTWIAFGGLLVNLASLWILAGGRRDSLNIRGAWLHVLSDALGSVGAMIAGLLVIWFDWYRADSIASILIGALIIYSAWRLLAESVSVLMESAPRGIDVDEVRRSIAEFAGIVEVHDLHVWSITSGLDCLSAHVVVEDNSRHAETLTALNDVLHDRYGIDHTTIQIEPRNFEERSLPV